MKHVARNNVTASDIMPDTPAAQDKPFWSVMIPTYNPRPYFEQTLQSILDQDPGPDQMQIAVVDDGSLQSDPEPIVQRLAGDRMTIFRSEKNLGLAENWNACISQAAGEMVAHHASGRPGIAGLLRGASPRSGVAGRSAGLAFTRAVNIDECGNWLHLSKLERTTAGIVPDWIERVAVNNRIQCPAIIVRADVYQNVGDSKTDLIYATDWEMWCRIAARYAVWFEPMIGIWLSRAFRFRNRAIAESCRIPPIAMCRRAIES